MPVPTLITDLSATPASNSPAGSESVTLTDDYLRTLAAFVRQVYNRMTDGTQAATVGDLTTTGNTALGNASTDALNVGNGDLVKDAAGNVGVGTSAPAYKMTVASTAEAGTPLYATLNTNLTSGSQLQFYVAHSTTDVALVNNRPGALSLGTSNAERMRIDSAGNVGIGTNAPQNKLNIQFDSSLNTVLNTPSIVLSNRTATSGTYLAGGIFSNTYRDISTSNYTAGVWFERANSAGAGAASTQGSVIFGTGENNSNGVLPTERMRITAAGVVQPGADNTQTLGSPSLRWSTVYAGTGTINTSDAREKTPVRGLTAAEISAARDLSREVGAYRWLAAVATKGSEARDHIGLTVQRAIEIMQSHGLDPMRYGFICHDTWEATNDTPESDRYAFRYDELTLFIAAGLESRLAALDARP